VLVHGAAGLLGRHAGLGYSSVAGHLGLHVFALGLLLRGWRGSRELLRRVLLLLGVHSLLLLLLEGGSVGVLVVHGRLGLASDVRRLGVLLHGNCEVLVGDWNRRIKCDEAWLPCRDQRKRVVNTSRAYSVGALKGRLEALTTLLLHFEG
jgi:hypothetical protein